MQVTTVFSYFKIKLLISFVLFVFLQKVSASTQASYYVSPIGNDANIGSIDAPFATLQQAQKAVATINSNMSGDIIVYLRGGNYDVKQQVNLGNADSGSNGHYVIYKNFPDEKPIISCGTKVTGWTLDAGSIYKANIGTGVDFRQLYVNGRREVRARTPNAGYKNIVSMAYDGFNINKGLLTGVTNLQNVEMAINVLWMHKKARISATKDTLTYTRATINPVEWEAITKEPQGSTAYAGNAYWLENAKEFLDAEGEWYFDKYTGILYYWPRNGEDINSSQFIIPTVETLFNLSGSFDLPAHHIEISGLEIRYTNWTRPNNYGLIDVQANSIIPSNLAAAVNTQYRHNQKKDRVAAAINAFSVSNVRVFNNRFISLGGNGVNFDMGGSHNSAIGNAFCDLSGGAIEVGNDAFAPTDSRMRPVSDTITNNYITYIGQEYYGACAIIAYYTDSIQISHNEISHVSYGGISFGWGWTDGNVITPHKPTNGKINNNRINFASEKLFDTGGIYTNNAGNICEIGYNYITNTVNDVGIFNDENTYNFNIHDNILEGNHTYNSASTGWIRTNGTQTNVTYTNNTNSGVIPTGRDAIVAAAGLEEPFKTTIYSDLPALVLTPDELPTNGGIFYTYEGGYQEQGTWNSSSLFGYNGSSTRYTNVVGATALWSPNLNEGKYNISFYALGNVSDPSTQVLISHAGTLNVKTADFNTTPNTWCSLGAYNFLKGNTGFVKTALQTSSTNLRTNAIKFDLDTSIPLPTSSTNVALGKTVTSSKTVKTGAVAKAVDGTMLDQTNSSIVTTALPLTLTVDFVKTYTISSVDVYTGNFNGTTYDAPISAMSLQYTTGNTWTTIPGSSITGNTDSHVIFSFPQISAKKIRVVATASNDNIARIYEVQAWTPVITEMNEITNSNSSLIIYPNPVTDFLNLSPLNSLVKGATIRILSLDGKTEILQQVNDVSNVSVDLRQLPNGLYFCRYNNGSEVKTVKILKNKF